MKQLWGPQAKTIFRLESRQQSKNEARIRCGLIGVQYIPDVSAELSRNFLSPGHEYFPLPKTSVLIPQGFNNQVSYYQSHCTIDLCKAFKSPRS